ncbi:hypothetical protein BGX24_008663 [Mortierella sp. AD032]|nr:hypothetical protein BGX24_008663 [Mortierella sp. AD032]
MPAANTTASITATVAMNEQAPRPSNERALPLVDINTPPAQGFAATAQGAHPLRNRVTDSVRLRDELMMWKGITPFILRKNCGNCKKNLVYGWCYECVTCMQCCRCIKDRMPVA